MSVVDSRQQQRDRYAVKLRNALEETGTSIYRVSRILNPAQPESARSNVQRYLAAKVLPGIESRAELAEALGRPELRSVDDDDEEADPVADLAQTLLQIIQFTVARERARDVA